MRAMQRRINFSEQQQQQQRACGARLIAIRRLALTRVLRDSPDGKMAFAERAAKEAHSSYIDDDGTLAYIYIDIALLL